MTYSSAKHRLPVLISCLAVLLSLTQACKPKSTVPPPPPPKVDNAQGHPTVQQAGTLAGVVSDSSGASVPGARVTLLDQRSASIGTTVTDSSGRYTLNQTAPPMAIQRRYQHSAVPADELVDALYQLLGDVGAGTPPSSSVSHPAGPADPEGARR